MWVRELALARVLESAELALGGLASAPVQDVERALAAQESALGPVVALDEGSGQEEAVPVRELVPEEAQAPGQEAGPVELAAASAVWVCVFCPLWILSS